MKAHELARLLLEGPDLPIATHANNHTYESTNRALGYLQVKVFNYCGVPHVVIGNLCDRKFGD